MKTNEGRADRIIRLIIGISISSFFIYHKSYWALLGLIPIVTAFVGVCPLYSILGINTLEKQKDISKFH